MSELPRNVSDFPARGLDDFALKVVKKSLGIPLIFIQGSQISLKILVFSLGDAKTFRNSSGSHKSSLDDVKDATSKTCSTLIGH